MCCTVSMKLPFLLFTLAALGFLSLLPGASAQLVVPNTPVFVPLTTPVILQPPIPQPPIPQPLWTQASLQGATFVVLAPTLDGRVALLSPDQQKSVLEAMQRDVQAAVLKKYPAATFVTDAATPGIITLHPVLTVPDALLPWSNFQARIELSQSGQNAVIKDTFGVFEVYQHQADAANYVFGKLAQKLP
jgi:hypothetical protein